MPLVEHFYLAYILGFGIQLLLISILTQVAGYQSPGAKHLESHAIANNRVCGCATHNRH
ncbi:hypothetical protein NIES4106_57890 (plasmid) [Fischerella sp. NIES-4106]|nr:hypothetical protein NIES4106_57890 [Fischerella sp. NIES-4106]